MRNRLHLHLLLGLATLATLALAVTPKAAFAQQDPPGAMKAQAHEPTAATKPAGCDTCSLCMKHLDMMAKLKKLLTEAKDLAGTEAKATIEKLDEALKLLEESHQKMHEQMKRHMHKMHGGMMHKGEGKMPEMMCPMCGKMMGPEPRVVNSTCPMTGKKVDPYNVPKDLTREFQGKKVGFCCPSCPPAWDKLSDQEKQEKLKAAVESSQ